MVCCVNRPSAAAPNPGSPGSSLSRDPVAPPGFSAPRAESGPDPSHAPPSPAVLLTGTSPAGVALTLQSQVQSPVLLDCAPISTLPGPALTAELRSDPSAASGAPRSPGPDPHQRTQPRSQAGALETRRPGSDCAGNTDTLPNSGQPLLSLFELGCVTLDFQGEGNTSEPPKTISILFLT